MQSSKVRHTPSAALARLAYRAGRVRHKSGIVPLALLDFHPFDTVLVVAVSALDVFVREAEDAGVLDCETLEIAEFAWFGQYDVIWEVEEIIMMTYPKSTPHPSTTPSSPTHKASPPC
jgi:hypothetical protein